MQILTSTDVVVLVISGEYVLTAYSEGKILHFRINSSVAGQGLYPRAQYHFEEEKFDHVSELVR